MKSNTDLRRDVYEELEWDPSLDADGIEVSAADGVVTLAGSVPRYGEKVTAEQVARRVLGVRAVINDIEVRPTGGLRHSDSDIARAAFSALKWEPAVPADRIRVSVSQGWLTLEGEVDRLDQKEAADEAVRHVLGVLGVRDHVVVRPRAPAPDGNVPDRGGIPAQRRVGGTEAPRGVVYRQGKLAR